jgi:MAF protein
MGEKNAPVEYVRILPVTHSPVLVLASNSPRRRELLSLGGWEFHVRPADVDESLLRDEAPQAYVLRLAGIKARAGARTSSPGETLLAADTTVTLDGVILGKPADKLEAESMLRHLRGRTHQVCTAIAVLDIDTQAFVTDLCVTDVPMRFYTDQEMRDYIGSGDPLDKAGAYAIQHAGFQPVERFSGCFASVMGLPLCHLLRTLRSLGIPSTADLPARCQAHLRYDCPVSSRILAGEEIG